MSKSHRKKNLIPVNQHINCFNCGNCSYIGEGDHICDMTMDIVIVDWMPTEDFYQCGGKDFERL